jgi:nitrous oxidase accessory protein NosD
MTVLGPVADVRAAAADIVVGAGQSVQAAVDDAPEGATITLAAGAFKESITITKSLTLQGAGWEKTMIGPDRTMPPSQKQKDEFFAALEATSDQQERAKIAVAFATRQAPPTLTVRKAKGVVLRGIKFRGPPDGDAAGRITTASLVTFDNATGSISECAVIGPFMNGITILAGSEVKIEKSLVAALWGTGVAAGARTRLQMSECDVRNCYHRCVTLATDEATVERCRISGSAWHGIRYDNCSPKVLSNHIFGNARSGIYASGRTSATVRGNVFWRNEMDAMSCWFNNVDNIEGNTIVGNLREGIAVLGESKPNLVRNVFLDHPIAVTCNKVASSVQQLAESPSGDPRIAENFFFNNTSEVQDGKAAKPLPPSNRSADPKVGGAVNNFNLAADSPARKADAGAADPIAFASPFAIQPEETSIIPDSETRDYSKWKKIAAQK